MAKEILLKKFNSNLLAETTQNLLKSYNIKSIIKTEGGVDFRGALGDNYGADLYVLEKDYKKAMKIINNSGFINP